MFLTQEDHVPTTRGWGCRRRPRRVRVARGDSRGVQLWAGGHGRDVGARRTCAPRRVAWRAPRRAAVGCGARGAAEREAAASRGGAPARAGRACGAGYAPRPCLRCLRCLRCCASSRASLLTRGGPDSPDSRPLFATGQPALPRRRPRRRRAAGRKALPANAGTSAARHRPRRASSYSIFSSRKQTGRCAIRLALAARRSRPLSTAIRAVYRPARATQAIAPSSGSHRRRRPRGPWLWRRRWAALRLRRWTWSSPPVSPPRAPPCRVPRKPACLPHMQDRARRSDMIGPDP